MLRSSLVCALLALSVAGCAASFDSGSKLKSLRVLAVKKDKPYARPGETVHLQMLLDDPRALLPDAGHGSSEKISVGWLGGCEDPNADSFEGCLTQFQNAGNLVLLPHALDTLDFSVTLSDDIISRQPAPANPTQPKSGSAFVFFALCATQVQFGGANSAFSCQSPSGEPLGPDDFVLGYTEVFAYEKFRNQNPKVTGFEVDGQPIDVDCVGDACVALEQEDFGIGFPAGPSMPSGPEGGLPSDAGALRDGGSLHEASVGLDASTAPQLMRPTCANGDPRCFQACTVDDDSKCPKHTVNLVVDKSSAEVDGVAEAIEGRNVGEQMWINYYTDAGKLDHDVKLLNDATTGWNDNHSADLHSPQALGTFHVWAAAHDNRGGVEWARITLATTSPY